MHPTRNSRAPQQRDCVVLVVHHSVEIQERCRSEKKAREALSRALAASQREAAANADAGNAGDYMNDAFMEGDDFSDSGDQLSGASEQTVTAEVLFFIHLCASQTCS